MLKNLFISKSDSLTYTRRSSVPHGVLQQCVILCFSKGISQSALPYRRSVPTWLRLTADDVKEQIFKLGKKGLTPSQIGVYS